MPDQPLKHQPNPFYFVAFHRPDKPEEGFDPVAFPMVRTVEQWEDPETFGDCVTGYAEFELTALQPVHVAGEQVPGAVEGQMTGRSCFHRQGDSPVIPGSVIKGMLRSFVEALSCGHLGFANDEYKKEFKQRHIGFSPFDAVENLHGPDKSFLRRMPPAAPGDVQLDEGALAEDKLDLAHFLFGYVRGSQHRAGRLVLDDVVLDPETLSDQFQLVDLKKAALLGGPKPSASNWWYFEPDRIAKRVVPLPNGRMADVVEPIGEKLRGRKFYFHQDAARCVEWYMNRANGWNSDKTPLYTFPAESLRPGAGGTFRISFEKLPRGLLQLLLRSLDTGTRMRHKLGMGKAFGFGSCQFALRRVMVRPAGSGFARPADITESILPSIEHVAYSEVHEAYYDLINPVILQELDTILTYEEDLVHKGTLFTYPRFGRGGRGFELPARWQDEYGEGEKKATDAVVEEVSRARPATSLEFYQKEAQDWDRIDARRISDPYADEE